MGETDCGGNWFLVLMGGAMPSKSLVQLSVDGWDYVPSLFFDLRSNYGGSNEDNGDVLEKVLCTATLSAPDPAAGHCQPTPLLETPGHSTGKSGSVSCGVTAPFSWVLMYTRFCLGPPRVCFPSPG